MRRRLRAAAASAALLVPAAATVAACGGPAPAAGGPARPTVVVTTNILGDIVEQVVGSQADVETLLPPGADPHAFALSAAQAERLAEADLVIANGLGLEAGMATELSQVAGARRVLEIGPHVDPMPFPDAVAGSVVPDPHVWTDPGRMRAAVGVIVRGVAALPGVDAAALERRGAAYDRRLAAMERSMAARLATIPEDRRVVVTNHHVLGYFAERFGFEVVGAVIPGAATLASPSAADLEELAGVLRSTGARAIFADSSHPARLAEVVATAAGIDVEVRTLFTESLGGPGSGADTYLRMLDTNTDLIVEALSDGDRVSTGSGS